MKVPYHIAIIMDGNGRWAKAHGLPRSAGHRKGAERVKEIVKEAKKRGVKILTIFAFSTENWDRPKQEINMLFSYLHMFFDAFKGELMKEDVKVVVIGRRDRIKPGIIKKIKEIEEQTAANKSFVFIIALDYGGRWDIVDAAKKIINDMQSGKGELSDLNEEFFGHYLSLGNYPDPDLLIRTSGEQRISNFLPWNLAYAELYFPLTCWPDFNGKELDKAIEEYSKRERRLGKITA